MIVLGINMSSYASSCIMVDGKIISVISEERLNRIKYYSDFPEKSILKVIEIAKIDPKNIDYVALGTKCETFDPNKTKDKEYRYVQKLASFLSLLFPLKLLEMELTRKIYFHLIGNYKKHRFLKKYKNFFATLGIHKNKIIYFDHHLCHAATAYYSNPEKKNPSLVFTCDGHGEGICATVSICQDEKIIRKQQISAVHSIGSFYSRATRFLGLNPWKDEYKVMGLAPWGNSIKGTKLHKSFNKIWINTGLSFKNTTGKMGDALIGYFFKKFPFIRFDHFAFCAQDKLESIVTTWINNNVDFYKIYDIGLSGGVFLNVKLNKKIMELPSIKNLYVFPSPSDDSICVGAAILATIKFQKTITPISPIYTTYFGEEISKYKNEFINAVNKNRYTITSSKNINKEIALLLSLNKMIAICRGRMEYGPRALGNRSILVNPSFLKNINFLNQYVKGRDFWMPFGATILDKFAYRYIVNPKNLNSPYMILSFDTYEKHRDHICASIHQKDFTIRPQILEKFFNPDFYEIIEHFESITGIGGILNTSLNLHGEPLVNSPLEAINFLKNSGIEYLVYDNYIVTKSMQNE